MLLADNVATVTSQKHYYAIYFSSSGYCCKMAAATTKSLVDKKVNYYPILFKYSGKYQLG
jgi:hypothetical protein